MEHTPRSGEYPNKCGKLVRPFYKQPEFITTGEIVVLSFEKLAQSVERESRNPGTPGSWSAPKF